MNAYLSQKRDALKERAAKIEAGGLGLVPLSATVSAEGRSGIRRIRIRDHQVITDSPPDFAGYDLGPSSPELQLGILGSCLNHSVLIQAALLDIEIESLDVDVHGRLDARAGRPGHEATPVSPHDLSYTIRIVSPASPERIAQLEAAVERACPLLNLIRNAQSIRGSVDHAVPTSDGGAHSDGEARAA